MVILFRQSSLHISPRQLAMSSSQMTVISRNAITESKKHLYLKNKRIERVLLGSRLLCSYKDAICFVSVSKHREWAVDLDSIYYSGSVYVASFVRKAGDATVPMHASWDTITLARHRMRSTGVPSCDSDRPRSYIYIY